MNHTIFLGALGVLLAGSVVSAQNPLGTFDNTGTTYTTRGNAAAPNNSACVVFVRHDKEAYAGWTTGAVAGRRDITGVNFVIQDENVATANTFNALVYTGDPAMPNFPLVSAPVAITGIFALPIGVGALAYNANVNFATPISAPASEDVYIGLQFNQAWTVSGPAVVDGLSVWEIRNVAIANTPPVDYDLNGARLPGTGPTNTFGGYYVAAPMSGPAYPVVTQFKIQPLVPIAGGVAATVTNQTFHPQSNLNAALSFTVQNPGAGTSSMFSGQFPDAASPPRNTGRADRIGQTYFNPALPAGSLVFWMIDIGGFASPEIPAYGFVPGSTGVACLNVGTMQVLGFSVIGANGGASNLTNFPAAVRPLLSGIDWLQQAIGVDISVNALHGSACSRQRT